MIARSTKIYNEQLKTLNRMERRANTVELIFGLMVVMISTILCFIICRVHNR